MDKLKMHSINKVDDNVDKIAQLFPNCVTEAIVDDKLTKVVDFDMLRQELSSFVIEGNEERYQFTWPDKRKSILLANAPIAKTLRPCKEESVDFDNTENLYIEGDNLDVLKLLQETYLGKIKMIYIDPPYNTGKDAFVYDDDSSISVSEFAHRSGQFDEEGNILFDMKTNNEANGRFHTDWLNMMYPRLKLAKDLLSDDGVIFISIDDNEVDNLKKVCSEIFGEENFIAAITVVNNLKGRSDDEYIATAHESMMFFRKSKEFKTFGVPLPQEYIDEYREYDTSGKFRLLGLRKRGTNSRRQDRPNMYYPLYGDTKTLQVSLVKDDNYTVEILPKLSDGSDGCWRWGRATAGERINELMLRYIAKRSEYDVYQKDYLMLNGKMRKAKAKSVWLDKKFSSDAGTIAFREIMQNKSFTSPKSIELIKYCLYQSTEKGSICLDFFSGSATTAHAVMQLNAEDGGSRKFIMVQLPEFTYGIKMKDKKGQNGNIIKDTEGNSIKVYDIDSATGYPKISKDSEARKAGYYTIPQIGKARIRKAGEKIKAEYDSMQLKIDEEPKKMPDIGFRVLKLDSTNLKDVYYNPEEYKPTLIDKAVDNIKNDRTPLDLLFQVMLDMDVLLSSKIEEIEIGGKKIFSVMDGYLIACFDTGITFEIVEAIAKKKPYYAVFRDSCMADDSTMASFEQIFETYSKETIRKVL